MELAGISHVSLSVTELPRSTRWYADVLGWTQQATGRSDTTTYAHGALPDGTSLVLRVHDEPSATLFDERRPGLDHLSFAVPSREDLVELEDRVRRAATTSTAIQELPYGHVLAFRDPDHIALEAVVRK